MLPAVVSWCTVGVGGSKASEPQIFGLFGYNIVVILKWFD
jgi:hypothetical protein